MQHSRKYQFIHELTTVVWICVLNKGGLKKKKAIKGETYCGNENDYFYQSAAQRMAE